jgi:GDP-L-fucose synthase
MISLDKRIFIAGAAGMVGSSLTKELSLRGYSNLLTPTSKETDLTNQKQVNDLFRSASPNVVVLAAARVGGILANNK